METIRNRASILAALGLIAAIATNTIANAGGLPSAGALLLFPVIGIFWYLTRYSRKEMGLALAPLHYYGLGLLHPVLVLGLISLAAWLTGAIDIQNPDWSKVALSFAITALVSILVAIWTEEGFFRGWLWAALQHAGLNRRSVVLFTGIAFGFWHLPFALLASGYDPLSAEVPLFITNASIIGIAWGLLRLGSGSIIVPAVTHGVWNSAVYVLFNFGGETGALGIHNVSTFGPEAGWLGLVLNLGYAAGLWLWYRRTDSIRVVPKTERSRPKVSGDVVESSHAELHGGTYRER
jgi:membrane protease YdiL (CAAX protease family)